MLQDLSYTYDPAGNITHIRDDAQQTIYFNNQVVTPDNDYTYDAIYRLIHADGREHIGQLSQPQTTWDDQFRVHLPQPGDGQAMRSYTEQYHYDAVGNFLQLIHQAANGNWTRDYAYNEPSLIEPGKNSNRLSSTTVGGNAPEAYLYDAARQHDRHAASVADAMGLQGSVERDLAAGGQRRHGGDHVLRLRRGGQRVRKVTERQNGTRKNERIYLGGFEVYREYDGSGNSVTLEARDLACDGRQAAHRAGGDSHAGQRRLSRHSSSAISSAIISARHRWSWMTQAQIISYEEYHPYGSTSYQAVRSAQQRLQSKRYRYTGKERDEESGFEYHGARYYAPWLARWTSPDPAGLVDGTCGLWVCDWQSSTQVGC